MAKEADTDANSFKNSVTSNGSEGVTITVYKKPPSEPFDVTEFLKELASVTASFATIYYIITATQ